MASIIRYCMYIAVRLYYTIFSLINTLVCFYNVLHYLVMIAKLTLYIIIIIIIRYLTSEFYSQNLTELVRGMDDYYYIIIFRRIPGRVTDD